MKEQIVSLYEKNLLAATGENQWALLILGGSFGKGINDEHSDIDISIITSSLNTVSIRESLLATRKVLYHEHGLLTEHFVILENSKVFDVHLMTDSYCKNAIHNFESGEDISNKVQDTIWNICNGIRLLEIGKCPSYDVTYSVKVQKLILEKFSSILSLQKLDVAFIRSDKLQQWEAKLAISKTLISIGFALNKELFWGYKNLKQKIDLPESIQDTLGIVQRINQENWGSLYPMLQTQIGNIRAYLISLLEIPDGV